MKQGPGRSASRAAAILIFAQYALGADIYKTVDAQGHVVYSDHPISSTSQPMALHVTAANPEEAARLDREQEQLSAEAAKEAQQQQNEAAERQKKAAEDAAQQRRCDAARNRYAMFAVGGRLMKSDAEGNRVFYSDEEIAAEAAASKAAMDSACVQ
jgi:nucleotide-binding universal stress UspA family protein